MEVTEEDLMLVHALQIVPRISWSDAARILGSHPTTLAARWERLRGSGLAWITANTVHPNMETTLAFLDVECTLAERNTAAELLCEIPEVLTVSESARNRDLMLIVQTDSIADLYRSVVPRITGIPGVTRFQASLCTRLHSEGHAWRLNALNREQREALGALAVTPSRAATLTDADMALVQCLMRDGRASAVEIAREIGVHSTTVSRRLNRIFASGMLSFRCELAQLDSEYPVTCQWFANVPLGQHNEAAEALRTFRNLRLCASTTGTTNFTFVMWLRSVAEIMTTGLEITKKVLDMHLVESSVALHYSKRVGWLLDENERATRTVVS